MAKSIVDVFELVQIEIQQGEFSTTAPSAVDHEFQTLLEAMPVVQAGKMVVFGKIQQLLGGLAFMRDIFVDPQASQHALVMVQDRVGQLHQDPSVVAIDFEALADFMGVQNLQDMFRGIFRTGELVR